MTKTESLAVLRRVLAGTEPVPTDAERLADLLRVASATRIGVLSRMVDSDELWEKACDIKSGTTVFNGGGGMTEPAVPADSTATTIHLHKPYTGSWTVCGNDEVPASETTERLSETTCPRCFHDGDPVPRTRALIVERAHAEALAEDAERAAEAQVNAWACRFGFGALSLQHERDYMIETDHAEALAENAKLVIREQALSAWGKVWAGSVPDGLSDAFKAGDYATAKALADAQIAEQERATEPAVPADLNDDAAWSTYCAALPEPTDGEMAAVMVEFHNPYAEQIADCHEGFRTSARMLWQKRAGLGTPMTFAYLRDAMRTYAACGRTYQALAEAAAYSALSRMHLAASVEGADACVVTYPETATVTYVVES